MKLCEICHIAEVMPIPLKDLQSTPAAMAESPSGLETWFYPTEEGKICYYCNQKSKGIIVKEEGRIENTKRY
jgi:hypothetical protein